MSKSREGIWEVDIIGKKQITMELLAWAIARHEFVASEDMRIKLDGLIEFEYPSYDRISDEDKESVVRFYFEVRYPWYRQMLSKNKPLGAIFTKSFNKFAVVI